MARSLQEISINFTRSLRDPLARSCKRSLNQIPERDLYTGSLCTRTSFDHDRNSDVQTRQSTTAKVQIQTTTTGSTNARLCTIINVLGVQSHGNRNQAAAKGYISRHSRFIYTHIYICVIHLNIGICASSMSWRDPTLSVRDL